MSKKRKNKKFLKKLLNQKMQQQSQPVQPQTAIVSQKQNLEPKAQHQTMPEPEIAKSSQQLIKEQAVESHDKQIRRIILGDMKRILLILIIIAALFAGVFFTNQKTTVFNKFSQKLLNLFNQS